MYSFPCGLFFSEGGLWDETGCRVESSNESQTLCVCSHLSTFAVLMDIHDYVVSGLECNVTNSFFFCSELPAVLGVRLGNVKENLCGSYVVETVKNFLKLIPYAMPYSMLAVILLTFRHRASSI